MTGIRFLGGSDIVNITDMEKSYIPKNKHDLNFLEDLENKNISEIKDDIPKLLEWLQDGNWPVAPYVANYFLPHINEVKDEIIQILRTNDEMWKYWIINGLLYTSTIIPDKMILLELKKLAEKPTFNEKDAEVDISAIDVLEKFNANYKIL